MLRLGGERSRFGRVEEGECGVAALIYVEEDGDDIVKGGGHVEGLESRY